MQPKKRNRKVSHVAPNQIEVLLNHAIVSISVMRLGKKKEKDRELEKEQIVEGVARLICSPNPKQSHPAPLRGN